MIRMFFRLIALMVRIVVVTAVAALASAALVLNLTDLDAKRQWIELTIERLTGREVTVAGPI